MATLSQRSDSDLRIGELYVSVRRYDDPDGYVGNAWPEEFPHADGKITLSIGDNIPEQDIIKLFAHELRHIGWFHRGRKRYHEFDCPLTEVEAENDAEQFERKILERWKNEKRTSTI